MPAHIPPYCQVSLDDDSTYRLAPKWYAMLAEMQDENIKGWVECELYEHATGKVRFQVEAIENLMLATKPWLDSVHALEMERKERELRGEE